ncbi:MAG: BglG family transcription antiterminator [Candidatus Izimaplasma sp.]|nr:BglG family transcription antiterminator [Candidatus Izimaplasma bacterium]
MLDYKDNYILNLLISSYQTLNVNDLSRLIGISQRSVYYSLARINDYLTSIKLPEIVNERQTGLKVDPKIKNRLNNEFDKELQNYYLCTQKERNAIEILLILFVDEIIKVSLFETLFDVSRNTIIGDIKEVKAILSTYNLGLEFEQNKGYIIDGTPLRKRSVALMIISSYEYLLKINTYGLFDIKQSKYIRGYFEKAESFLHIKYVDNAIEYLSIMLAMIDKHGIDHVIFDDEDHHLITNSIEYETIKKTFTEDWMIEEYEYIALQLLGMRIQDNSKMATYDDQSISQIVHFMIHEFSRLTLIYFDEEQRLFDHLYLHMKQAMFRFKYGIIFQNELKDEIFENYPQITSISRQICNTLEQRLGYPIGDDDVAYIAMHFGGYMKREKRDFPMVKVLLVCLNGIATSKLLKKELEYLLGQIEIIDVVRKEDIDNYKNQVDYIISTIPLDDESLADITVQVHSVLTDRDKDKIVKKLGVYNPNEAEVSLSNKIIEDINDYIPKEKRETVRRKILKRLSEKRPTQNQYGRMTKPMLKETITKSRIMFLNQVTNWEDAIYKSGEPLLKEKYIEKKYLDKVVENVKKLGPYIVIADKIAISHARPEDGVNDLGMSILLLEKPVIFHGKNDREVNVIVTLAAPDNEKHLLALQQLSQLFMESLEELLAAKTKEDVLKLVEQYSKEETKNEN